MQLLEIPFYLDLFLQYAENLPAMKFVDYYYLIELHIRKFIPNKKATYEFGTTVAEQRMEVLRRLLFAKNKNDSVYVTLNIQGREEIIKRAPRRPYFDILG